MEATKPSNVALPFLCLEDDRTDCGERILYAVVELGIQRCFSACSRSVMSMLAPTIRCARHQRFRAPGR